MIPDALRIEVLQSDIDEGARGDGCYCPIARAAMRALDVTDPLAIFVEATFIDLRSYDPFAVLATWLLPQSAQDFISAFDGPVDDPESDPVAVYPFSFVAEPVA